MMRSAFRWLIYLVAITLTCLVVTWLTIPGASEILHEHLPSLLKDQQEQPSRIQSPANRSTTASVPAATLVSHDKINEFWSHWGAVFEDARPKVDKINYGYESSIVPVLTGDTSDRKPPYNHVLNPDSDIQSLRSSHAILLKAINSQELGENIYAGKGVVTVAGGEYFGPAIIGILMLRRSGSDLPVEVFVADDSEYEGYLCTTYLPRFNARCLILTDFLSASFEVRHYQLKSLAILFSSFDEVLYVDSDSFPLVDPSKELFAKEPYKSTGLVIWPDFWVSTESSYFYTVAGMDDFPANLPQTSCEAGQLLIHKSKHLRTMLLWTYYNIYGPDYYYPLLSQGALGQGDKETFMAAAIVLNASYYRVETPVSVLQRYDGREIKGSAMVQHNPWLDFQRRTTNLTRTGFAVRPAFVHANTPKMNAGHLVDEGDLQTVGKDTRVRLWGSKSDQKAVFGSDLEKIVWEYLLVTGCELAHQLREWRNRERLCERLEEHFHDVFGERSHKHQP